MIWKPTTIQGYEVSDTGLIRSKYRILKATVNRKGYEVVYPSNKHKSGYKTSCLVHRLVAEAFIENPDNKPQVNHKDTNKRNNFVDNLEWATNLENHTHKLDNNLVPETHTPKRVGQFTKSGELVATFASIYEAGHSVKSNQYGVSRVVNGLRATHKGFVWRYV
jgi:hypothetical protein